MTSQKPENPFGILYIEFILIQSSKPSREVINVKMFAVKVTAYIPYPITREYTQCTSGLPTAVARSIRLYRKDPRVIRKRIKQMTINVGVGFS